MSNQKTLTVALWAGPGVGKSVTAANLFVALKMARVSAELVPEYAKDLVYEDRLRGTPQMELLKEQHRRLQRVQGHVAVAVTDAPLHVSELYSEDHEVAEVREYLREHGSAFEVWNVLLSRDIRGAYERAGRWQTENEAHDFHHRVLAPFVKQVPGQRYFELHVDVAPRTLVREVLRWQGGLTPQALVA